MRRLPGGSVRWADERLGVGALVQRNLRRAFPDHWSFLFGQITLWSFVVLLLTGVFLTFWFEPGLTEVTYQGSYEPLRGLQMSEAYASTLELSFDVRGGLLMRQMHHWASHIFIAAMLLHLMRVFLTGAFRKPRALNWVIGCLLLVLGILEGFTGYSLLDDLLSGTGLRVAEGVMRSIPVVGTYLSFFVFGGEFPGDDIIPRLHALHVLLLPGLMLALIAVDLVLHFHHRHAQWPGPGRTNTNVVGRPLPVYLVKAGGLFFIVFGVTALMGATMQINPVWAYGPSNPAAGTAGSQPGWYLGVVDGLVRIMPGWESEIAGYTLSWAVLVPGVMVPSLLVGSLLLYPFVEGWITGDKREHHLLQRPRDVPTRTALMAAMITLYGVLWAAGGDDILATTFHLSFNQITYFVRVAVFVGPVTAFVVARRWCISLQRHENEKLLHGRETGVIARDPAGGYSEEHAPLPLNRGQTLITSNRRELPPPTSETDVNGVAAPTSLKERLRGRLSRAWLSTDVERPTREQLEGSNLHGGNEPVEHPARDRQMPAG